MGEQTLIESTSVSREGATQGASAVTVRLSALPALLTPPHLSMERKYLRFSKIPSPPAIASVTRVSFLHVVIETVKAVK